MSIMTRHCLVKVAMVKEIVPSDKVLLRIAELGVQCMIFEYHLE